MILLLVNVPVGGGNKPPWAMHLPVLHERRRLLRTLGLLGRRQRVHSLRLVGKGLLWVKVHDAGYHQPYRKSPDAMEGWGEQSPSSLRI